MEKDNIEQLLTNTFDDYSVPEFKNSWPGIKREVFRKQFFKFKLYQFNVYYGIVAVATMITAGILFFSPSEPEKALPLPVEVEDVYEVPLAQDSLSLENRREKLPQKSAKDTSVGKSAELAPAPDREAVSTKDLEADAPSSKVEEERKVEVSHDTPVLMDVPILNSDVEGDSTQMESLSPLDAIESIAVEKDVDSLIKDTLESERKKVIVVEPPVVKRDTVVKVIRERRRR
jgi:hypothetical protein